MTDPFTWIVRMIDGRFPFVTEDWVRSAYANTARLARPRRGAARLDMLIERLRRLPKVARVVAKVATVREYEIHGVRTISCGTGWEAI